MRSEREIDAIVEQAEKAERERCAKIAETWHPMLYAPELNGSHPRDAAYRDARSGIAAAILAQR